MYLNSPYFGLAFRRKTSTKLSYRSVLLAPLNIWIRLVPCSRFFLERFILDIVQTPFLQFEKEFLGTKIGGRHVLSREWNPRFEAKIPLLQDTEQEERMLTFLTHCFLCIILKPNLIRGQLSSTFGSLVSSEKFFYLWSSTYSSSSWRFLELELC